MQKHLKCIIAKERDMEQPTWWHLVDPKPAIQLNILETIHWLKLCFFITSKYLSTTVSENSVQDSCSVGTRKNMV